MRQPPALGPRGEGWVAIQGVLFAGVGVAGIVASGGWTGPVAGVTLVTGWLLVGAGGILAAAALAGLHGGDALTAVPHPRDEARLIESGPYRLVRHPVYGGLILAAIGWGLIRASPAALVAAAILLGFFDLKRRREEVWLRERFPGYAAYAARTRRLIPWLY
jgi:protein-S-isoprenylcysteine O-methyltransferase Ste14